ncbi:MAG TPA: hypothetical protein VIG99_29090 [Myxococcaceae bacterium]|jgi:hypothetical protein
MRASRLGAAVLFAAAAVTIISCPMQHTYPGREIVTFSFVARPAPGGVDQCRDAGYKEVPASDASFTFLAIYSGEDDGTVKWLTLGEFVRDAGFDGRLLLSFQSAPRVFELCGDAGVDEQLYVAPITSTQNQALGGACPEDPLAPGSIPVDPDAGIVPPGWRLDHFEAFRSCGKLVDTIHAAGDRACPTCTMVFDLEGSRQ